MHILDAHSINKDVAYDYDAEITALAFDESLRKLISGAHGGTVAIWNFNNGVLIKKFKADPEAIKGSGEITSIIHKNERLCLSSWNKTFIVYHLGSGGVQFLLKYPFFHSEIILSMDFHQNRLATASYDGKIIFWSVEIGLPTTEFRLKDSIKLEFVDRSHEIIKKIKKKPKKCSIAEAEGFNSVATMPKVDKTYNLLENNNYYTDKILFLKTRTMNRQTANFFSAGALGWVKAWSTDVNGQLLGHFNASHNQYDSISTFCFDKNEMLLFTGLLKSSISMIFN